MALVMNYVSRAKNIYVVFTEATRDEGGINIKNILLIDIDSVYANLALMKISSFHKAQGDSITFYRPNFKKGSLYCLNAPRPDVVYASIIFKKNKDKVKNLKDFYPNSKINIGGSGYNLIKTLLPQIDLMPPDYTIYPSLDYSLGFTSRGCIRDCYFCIVRKKEGYFKRYAHPEGWHNPQFHKISFLDNNILADKEWFYNITNWCLENNLKVDFTQGLDIRLLDEDDAQQIKKLNFFRNIKFAFDDSRLYSLIEEKLKILIKAGINIRQNVQFYVYCDDDKHVADALWRCNFLKAHNTNPFVMCNIDLERTQQMVDLQRWADRKQLFWSMTFEEYSSKNIKSSINGGKR